MSQIPNDSTNPYGVSSYPSQPLTDPNNSLQTQFLILGVIFIILAIMGAVGGILGLIGNALQIANGGAEPPPEIDEAGRIGHYIGFYGALMGIFVSILAQPFILWAGINMLRMKGRQIIWIGAILATIPFLTSCCILGTPFGIWALIALSSSKTKEIIP